MPPAVRRPGAVLARLFALPLTDVLRGQARCLRGGRDLVLLLGGLVAGWWVYVPVHELLHALGCRAAGGVVSRLEIAPEYGGALFARAIPWVVSGGDYAGRLSGFDTRGSDLVYLATDLGPFVLTLLPGVWALRRTARARRPLFFGAVAPFALAPLLSLTGDAYEIGSILVTRLPPWTTTGALLRGDDVTLAAVRVAAAGVGAPWGGLVLGALLGVVWAIATYGLGGAVAHALGQPALAAEPRGQPALAAEPRAVDTERG